MNLSLPLLISLCLSAILPTDAAHQSGWVAACQLAGWTEEGPRWQAESLADSQIVRWGAVPQRYSAGCIELIDGSILEGRILKIDTSAVTVQSEFLTFAPIPLEFVAAIVCSASFSKSPSRNALSELARNLAGSDDILLKTNRMELRGRFLPDANGVIWEPNRSALNLRLSATNQAVASNELDLIVPCPALRNPVSSQEQFRLALSDGSTLHVQKIDASGHARLACGISVQVHSEDQAWWKSIVGWMDSQAAWLAAQDSVGEVAQPLVGPSLALPQRDLFTRPLHSEGEGSVPFRGIRMSVFSQAAFSLGANAQRLLGEVMVVSQQGSTARFRVRVLAGAEVSSLTERFQADLSAEVLTPLPVRASLEQSKLVVLAVEPLNASAAGASIEWLDLRWAGRDTLLE